MEKIKYSRIDGSHAHYLASTMYALEDAYQSASVFKYRAWNYCKQLANQYGGYNLKVISYNCHIFTAGFEYLDDSGRLHFVKITKAHDYDAIVE